MIQSKIFIKIIITFFVSQSFTFTELAQSKYELNARDFAFEGIDFGTSLSKFKQKFPKPSYYEKTDGMDSYLIEFPSNSPSVALFFFYKGKFCQLTLYYTGLTTDKKRLNFIETMIKKFGSNIEPQEEGLVVWNFPTVSRRIGMRPRNFEDDDDGIILVISDTRITEKIYKDNSESVYLGF